MEECIVARWLKQKGDSVSAGDVIAEIETDKTTVEISAPVAGTILEVDFEEGAIAPVFQRLCLIGPAGEARAAAPAPAAQLSPVVAPAVAAASPQVEWAPTPESKPASGVAGNGSAPIFSPRARRFAQEHNFHPASVAGSGPGGRVLVADVEKLYATATAAAAAAAARPAAAPAPAAPATACPPSASALPAACGNRSAAPRNIRCTPGRMPAACWPCAPKSRLRPRPCRSPSTTWCCLPWLARWWKCRR